jgi:hypothetical protein
VVAAMNFQALTDLAGGRLGVIHTVCPLCSHQRRPQNRRKRVLRLWVDTDAITFCCVHCGAKGYVLADNRRRLTEGGRERFELRRAEASDIRPTTTRRSTTRRCGYGGDPARQRVRSSRPISPSGGSGSNPSRQLCGSCRRQSRNVTRR